MRAVPAIATPAVAAVSLLLASCGGTGSDLDITITAPPAGGATADESYIVEWTLDTEGWADAWVNIYVDTDLDPTSGLVLIAESLGVEQTGFNWDCATFPAGDYWVRGVIREGGYEESDYSDGVLTVSHTSTAAPDSVWVDAGSSSGTSVTVRWTAVPDAESYDVEFDADSSGSWNTVAEAVEGTEYTHTAQSAGLYAVRTNDAEGQSARSQEASTMPALSEGSYTLWEEDVPDGYPVGMYLNPCVPSLSYDYADGNYHVYCHTSALEPAALFSGSAPPVGQGTACPMADGTGSSAVAPEDPAAYSDSIAAVTDGLIFGQTPQGNYVKLLVEGVEANPEAPSVSGVTFSYEYQEINGLRLFTATE
ncbi:MAG: hypothetical protein R6U36_05175 [Candidatus Fermentibacteraceae bacterium]